MKEIIDRISSYNLFNYLFLGIIFVILLGWATSFNLILYNNFLGAFLYYFVGLVISRIDSLNIQPILRKMNFVKFSKYKDFIDATKADNKIELFAEINSTYRNLISLFFCLSLCILYDKFQLDKLLLDTLSIHNPNINIYILTIGLLILFVFSYKKQTSYINKCIEKNKNK